MTLLQLQCCKCFIFFLSSIHHCMFPSPSWLRSVLAKITANVGKLFNFQSLQLHHYSLDFERMQCSIIYNYYNYFFLLIGCITFNRKVKCSLSMLLYPNIILQGPLNMNSNVLHVSNKTQHSYSMFTYLYSHAVSY